MARKKEKFCPFSDDGCKTENQVCVFWGNKKGCDLQNAILALKSLPNLLRRIEATLREIDVSSKS